MDEQPDIVSSGPGPRHSAWIVFTVVLLVLLGVISGLAVTVVHRDSTIASLHQALHQAQQRTQRATAAPAQLTGAFSAVFALPSVRLGSYAIGVAAVRAQPGSAELTWIFVYGQHAQPGQSYGLLQGRCGGQFVTPTDLANGTADRNGDLTIEAPDPDVSLTASDIYLQLYRLDDGTPLGGVRGPLVSGAQTFVSKPSCPSLFARARVEERPTAQHLQEDASHVPP